MTQTATSVTKPLTCLPARLPAAMQLIKIRNKQELARYGLQREADFRAMLHQYAAVQAQHVQAQADLWAGLAKSLEG